VLSPPTTYPVPKFGERPNREERTQAASIRRQGARVDGMASACELSINVVKYEQAEDALRPGPNGNAAGAGVEWSPAMSTGYPNGFHAAGGQREPKPVLSFKRNMVSP
jgi:hypothetical protein